MTPAQAFAALRRLTPEGALAFLRQRGQITQTWSWADQAAAEDWTAQQLIDRLPDLLTKMDPAALADSLTRATATARLAGAAGIPPAQE